MTPVDVSSHARSLGQWSTCCVAKLQVNAIVGHADLNAIVPSRGSWSMYSPMLVW